MKVILYLLITVIMISVVRMVAGVLMKSISLFLQGSQSGPAGSRPGAASSVPRSGELKKDPVCGTFISTVSSVKKTVDGAVVHFCSVECRDKFQP
jgi:YHS domain-containing protein